MDRSMAYHAHVGLGNTQETGEIRARSLIIESHDDYGAFALFQILHTAPELLAVDARYGRLDGRRQLRPDLFEQAFFSLRGAADVERRHPARSEDKGSKLL